MRAAIAVVPGDGRKQAGLRFLEQRLRRAVGGLGLGDRIVGDDDAAFRGSNLGSLNARHQAPRSMASIGVACFQPLSSLYLTGSGAGGLISVGADRASRERRGKSQAEKRRGKKTDGGFSIGARSWVKNN